MVVCGIVGPSYSSSTAIGYLLGSSDNVFFVSELWRVLESDVEKVFCVFHGKACEFWTPNVIEECRAAGHQGIYGVLKKRMPEALLVDGSKHPNFYRKLLKRNQHCAFFLEAQKHPARFLASYFYNDFLKRNYPRIYAESSLEDIGVNKDIQAEFLEKESSAVLQRIISVYRAGRLFFREKGVAWRGVKHEEIVDRSYLHDLAAWVERESGLRCSLNRDTFEYKGMHPIGGNMAPSWIASGENLRDAKNARKRYYAGGSGVTLDNKKDLLFSEHSKEMIEKIPLYSDLLDLLGYGKGNEYITGGG